MKKMLLTWDSYNHGFVVIAKVLQLLQQNHNIEIDEIHYLHNNDLSEQNLAEKRLFYKESRINELSNNFKKTIDFESKIKPRFEEVDKIRYILERDKIKLPKFNQKRIHLKNITDYQSIYDNLRDFIKSFYKEDVELHINVSPGTPQMHVVWLMLNTSGILPLNTTLWSSQWNKKNKKTTLEKINFKPKTFLSEVFEKKFLGNTPNINPNLTKSEKRKIAERKLNIFSKIPKTPILLLGERGTGKSTYVRKFVKQKNEEYVELACGTLTDDLMRSELFGYEKGAFTGAISKKEGFLTKLEKGGLLFLDEIQDLSKSLQRQLMQVLQTGIYYPIGSTEPKKSDFRIVVASNIEYSDLAKKLDADFLDRISRFIVEIPPVRACLEDIEFYWEEVWKEVANFEDAPSKIWNEQLSKFILKQELKGNFRDLQKLAAYILAFYLETHIEEVAINNAISEYDKWKKIESNEKKYFKQNQSYNEIIAKFNKDLALWAIKKYGSKKLASEILNRSVSMLSKDLREERLNKK